MMNLRFRHGHDQDANIISEISDLPEVPPETTEDEEKFDTLLDNAVSGYVNYQLERVYGALLGDVFNVMISHLAVIDAPEVYRKMRDALLGDHRSHVERHLLTFSHELHSDLDAEVQRYKKGDLRINPHGPYYFFMYDHPDDGKIFGKPMSLTSTPAERLKAKKEFSSKYSCSTLDLMNCWSTGNLKAHFQAYLKKIYNRAIFIEQLIDFCETCAWINQSLEEFSLGAQILNNEVPGVVLTYIGTTTIEETGFTLKGDFRRNADADYESRTVRADPDANKGLPFAYPVLENLRVGTVNGNVDSTIEDEKVVRVTSQDGSALEFLHKNAAGAKVAIADIEPLEPTDENQVEKIYELPAKHFKKQLYVAQATS